MIAGVVAVVICGIRGHINMNATHVRRGWRPGHCDRLRHEGIAVLDELYRRINRAPFAAFKTGVFADDKLAGASGKIAGLRFGKIAIQTRRHLKSIDFCGGIGDNDRQRLWPTTRSVIEPVRKIHHHIAAAGIQRAVRMTARRGAGLRIVARRACVPRIGSRGVTENQSRGRSHCCHARNELVSPRHMFCRPFILSNTPALFLLWCLMEFRSILSW